MLWFGFVRPILSFTVILNLRIFGRVKHSAGKTIEYRFCERTKNLLALLHVILRERSDRRIPSDFREILRLKPQDNIKSVQPFTFSTFQLSSRFTLHSSLYRSPKCLSIFFPKTNLSSFHPFNSLHASPFTPHSDKDLSPCSPIAFLNSPHSSPFTLHFDKNLSPYRLAAPRP